MPVSTLIRHFLTDAGRTDLADHHELEPFSIHVLDVELTLCERIMGLVRASYEANPAQAFRRRIRHFYDLAMILRVNRYRSSWPQSIRRFDEPSESV